MATTRRLTELAASVEARVSLPGGDLVAAVSGGADSAVVGWLVAQTGGRAIHVDHGLPGSPAMRAAAEAVARALELELRILSVEPEGSSEAVLRHARYGAIFHDLAPDEIVVLGHTADDQAETVLMQLIRGSGLDGLAGIPSRQDRLVRPLLSVWRSETRELATLLSLPWTDDPANGDLRYFRNRVRLALLPHLEESHVAGLPERLVRMAGFVRGDLEILDRAVSRVPVERSDRGFRVARGALLAVGEDMARRLIRRELGRLAGGVPPDAASVGRVLEVAHRRVRSTQVSGGHHAIVDGPFVVVESAGNAIAPGPEDLLPGAVTWSRFRMEVTVVDRPVAVPMSPWSAVIPLDDDLAPPVLRAVRREDRIGPDDRGSLVTEAIAAAGVGTRKRVWPVVEYGGRVVWVPGIRRSGWSQEHPRRYLCAVAVEDSTWGPFER